MKNIKSYVRIVILSWVLTLISIPVSAQKNSYIESNKILAKNLSIKYGIPSSIILAIAFVETGGGSSKNSKLLNNHFGIVGNNNAGSKYKQFSSIEEGYEAFCKLLTQKKFYTSLKGINNFSTWVKAIASSGYSTQPEEWMRRLNLISNKYQLEN